MSTLAERVSLAFKVARVEKLVTQRGLAVAVGVTPPSINQWFGGKTKSIDREIANKAAEYLGCNPIWLMTGTGEPYDNTTRIKADDIKFDINSIPDDDLPKGYSTKEPYYPTLTKKVNIDLDAINDAIKVRDAAGLVQMYLNEINNAVRLISEVKDYFNAQTVEKEHFFDLMEKSIFSENEKLRKTYRTMLGIKLNQVFSAKFFEELEEIVKKPLNPDENENV